VSVTAEGKLTDEGHFAATAIMAKCPSKYEMQNRAAMGEKAPHDTMAPLEPASTSVEPGAAGPLPAQGL
jgi:cytochrome c-type biogenesis protein CcmE